MGSPFSRIFPRFLSNFKVIQTIGGTPALGSFPLQKIPAANQPAFRLILLEDDSIKIAYGYVKKYKLFWENQSSHLCPNFKKSFGRHEF